MAALDYRTGTTSGYVAIPTSIYVDNSDLYNKNFSGVQFNDPRFGFTHQQYIFYLQKIIEDLKKEEQGTESKARKAIHIAEMERIIKARQSK